MTKVTGVCRGIIVGLFTKSPWMRTFRLVVSTVVAEPAASYFTYTGHYNSKRWSCRSFQWPPRLWPTPNRWLAEAIRNLHKRLSPFAKTRCVRSSQRTPAATNQLCVGVRRIVRSERNDGFQFVSRTTGCFHHGSARRPRACFKNIS